MNERELSEKLDDIASRLERCDNVYQAYDIAEEIRKLSNEKYAPGSSLSWDAVKPKTAKPQGGFIQRGKRTPF